RLATWPRGPFRGSYRCLCDSTAQPVSDCSVGTIVPTGQTPQQWPRVVRVAKTKKLNLYTATPEFITF
ncbi:MAG: hypothetical protein KAS23_03685, partial [Anaerohalosphaera sp.]|nr:hypothetical protein [Anaerohalosphaera sp.]